MGKKAPNRARNESLDGVPISSYYMGNNNYPNSTNQKIFNTKFCYSRGTSLELNIIHNF